MSAYGFTNVHRETFFAILVSNPEAFFYPLTSCPLDFKASFPGKRKGYVQPDPSKVVEIAPNLDYSLCNGEPYSTIFTLPNGTIYVFKGTVFNLELLVGF